MTFRTSLLYARKFVFPDARSRFAGTQPQNGHRSLLGAMVCIGISLIPLVAVLVVSNGMIEGITGRIIGLSTQDISVHFDADAPDVASVEALRALAEELQEQEGVDAAFPEIQGMALAAGADYRTGALVRAIPTDMFQRHAAFSSLFTVLEGAAELAGGRTAVIGEKIARDLDLHAGDKIKIITTSASAATGSIVPRLALYTVGGIVSCGYQELDALWVFIPLDEGYSLFSGRSSQRLIGLTTSDTFSPALMDIRAAVQSRLPFARAYTWNELNASQYENFASTKILLLLIMLLIVLVASINISSALVMIVMERRKEIAILKSVGASKAGVAAAFLLIGFCAGAGGVCMGLPLGLLTAVNINQLIVLLEKILNIFAKFVYLLRHRDVSLYRSIHLLDPAYYLQQIPVTVPFTELFIIILGTLLLSLLVSAIPAVKAGKEKPLDTLRKM